MPDSSEERLLGVFYGRPALRVDFLALMGDRMPGGNGAGIAKDIFASEFPPGFESHRHHRAGASLLHRGRAQFERNVYLAAIGLFVVVQPVYEALDKLVTGAGAGVDKAALMAGYGADEESRLLADLWACSRGPARTHADPKGDQPPAG